MSDKVIDFDVVNKVPVFKVPGFTPDLGRVIGGKYNKFKKEWWYPAFLPYGPLVLHDLEIVDETLRLSSRAELQKLLLAQQQCNLEQNKLLRKGERQPNHPFSFIVKPYSHQLKSFVHCFYNPRTALLLEPGLGKSGIVINLIRYLKYLGQENHKALVICPKAILHKWNKEINFQSGGELTTQLVHGTIKKKRQQVQSPADIHVMTYGTASGSKAHSSSQTESTSYPKETFDEFIYRELDYGVIVLDESHNLLSPTSNKTKSCLFLSGKANRRIAMTGTASLGNPVHLWGQLRFLTPTTVESFWHYRNKFLKFADDRRRIVVGYRGLDVLQRRVDRTSVIYKAEECLDLPELTVIDAPYQLSPKQRKDYNDLVLSTSRELESKLKVVDAATATTRLTKLLQICSGFQYQSNTDPDICNGCSYLPHCVEQGIKPYTKRCYKIKAKPKATTLKYKLNPKMDLLADLMDSIMRNKKNKVIVWAHYREELNQIEECMRKRGDGYVRVDGSTSSPQASEANDRFDNDPDCRVYIGQIATGIGIDLVAANYTIYYSLDYDLGHYKQSLHRNHRIGQNRSVQVYRLIGERSVEEFIAKSLEQKQSIADSLTSKIHCVICKEQSRCLDNNILPFTEGCIYDANANKIVTRPNVV